MIGAGLLAKKAVERGLDAQAVGQVVARARLEGRHRVLRARRPDAVPRGSSASTPSATAARPASATPGPLPEPISEAIAEGDLVVCAVLSGQPQLRGAHPPRGEGELPRLAAARRRVRARRPDGPRPDDASRSARTRTARTSTCATSGRPRPRSRRRSPASVDGEMFQPHVRRRLHRRRELARARRAGGRPLRLGARLDLRAAAALLRRHAAASRRRSRTSPARAASSCSATRSRPTTSRRPARSGPTRPAGRYLVEHGVERKDFNSYGSRRGNHEVMVRGTFANVRLRNLLVPGSRGDVDGAPARRARR